MTRVRAPGPTYDVAGDVVTRFKRRARRRLRKPNQTQAPLAPGVPVDVAHEGALRPGEVVAVDGDAGTCDVTLADGTPLQGVAATAVLALRRGALPLPSSPVEIRDVSRIFFTKGSVGH